MTFLLRYLNRHADFDNPKHSEENVARLKQMTPFQLNAALVKNKKSKIMHEMPIHDAEAGTVT